MNNLTAEEIEAPILGAIILSPQMSFDDLNGTFTPAAFSNPQNRFIAEQLGAMQAAGKTIDLLTVVQYIQKYNKWEKHFMTFGDCAFHISKLTNGVASSANISAHMAIVREKHTARELVYHMNTACADLAQGYDVGEIFDRLKRKFEDIDSQAATGSVVHISEVQVLESVVHAHNNPNETGIPTGLRKLDDLTGGWQEGEITVLGARPGMGKTSLALGFVLAAAEAEHGVGIISLEMTNQQLKRRLVATRSKVSVNKMRTGSTTKTDLQSVETTENALNNYGIWFDETAFRCGEIRRSIRQLVKQGCKLIMLDFIQLSKGDDGVRYANRNLELEAVAIMIQQEAKKHRIHIIELSQLKKPDGRGRHVALPQLSDFRDCGAIEQCANNAIGIHRRDYYEDNPTNENGDDMTGIAELIILKCRDGATGTVYSRFIPHLTQFTDFDTFDDLPSDNATMTNNRPDDNDQIPF